MKKSYLFPNYFKKIGWAIILIVILLVTLDSFKIIETDNLKFNTISLYGNNLVFRIDGTSNDSFFQKTECNFLTIYLVSIGIGVIFVAFSKERIEDEYISKIREQSLVWSILISSFINIFSALFIYGGLYLVIALLITPFLLFVCYFLKFNFEIYKLKKSLKNEE